MARSTPVNSGYTIINGSSTGSNAASVNCWLEYKVLSQSVADNTSKVRVLLYAASTASSSTKWTTAEKFGYVGYDSANKKYRSTTYNFANNAVNCFGDYTFTITHGNDGKKTVTLEGSWKTSHSTYISGGSASGEVTLPLIARASSIASAGDVTLGNKCSVKWTPQSKDFRYKLKFAIGTWSHTTGVIHPNKTTEYTYSDYTIPLEVANQFKKAAADMTVTLYTYPDANATDSVGSDSKTLKATVPDNDDTKPTVSMTLSAVSDFEGLYLQRKSKVTATITASGKYGADVTAKGLLIDGKACNSLTSDYLAKVGEVIVTGTATDSRGYTGKTEASIAVIAYDNPKILAVAAYRCDSEGNASSVGTYLRISATRSYSPVEGRNACQIRYRYREDGGKYGAWAKILEESSESDSVTTEALLDGLLDKTKVYIVEVGVVDKVGNDASTTINIPCEDIYMHRPAGGKSMGLGGYVEEDGLFDVHWNQRVRGKATFDQEFSVQGKRLVDLLYPVGSIYISTQAANPATFFGGTWERIENRFLLAAGSSYQPGSTGGEAAHTLTTEEMPGHSHSENLRAYGYSGWNSYETTSYSVIFPSTDTSMYKSAGFSTNAATVSATVNTGSTGGSGAHNNMPPYLAVYIWKRIG